MVSRLRDGRKKIARAHRTRTAHAPTQAGARLRPAHVFRKVKDPPMALGPLANGLQQICNRSRANSDRHFLPKYQISCDDVLASCSVMARRE
ncbi:hypothetical protein PAHAL_6G276800 [Panicum hallii]|jgi:hypothetical protein|uniref:Uncharacterized protein n=1 Tax=Panicum hallii TaxID=206008 RepID=A0A2T8II21_9POAL|nr:hypothetical protein PAHAL_6G276800 [Panicum hallii]